MHCLTAWGQWRVQLLQYTAAPPGGSGQWNSCNALPHCLGAVGSATPAMQYPTARGQWAVQLLQCTAKANGGSSASENRAHLPGGDGEPSPGGCWSLLQGQWGAILFREPGAPAWGGRGAQPRGCSESPVRPMGGHLLQRTGRTGLGGTGSPAQGVFGVSCKANGGPSASENQAHRPGGDGEPSPGGVRSLL